MASLSDIFATAKNVATAINQIAQVYLNVQGILNTTNITGDTVVRIGAGRVCSVSVIDAGSASGFIYDSNSISITSAPVYIIPMTEGITVVNFPVVNGVFVSPGSGQIISVSYS